MAFGWVELELEILVGSDIFSVSKMSNFKIRIFSRTNWFKKFGPMYECNIYEKVSHFFI